VWCAGRAPAAAPAAPTPVASLWCSDVTPWTLVCSSCLRGSCHAPAAGLHSVHARRGGGGLTWSWGMRLSKCRRSRSYSGRQGSCRPRVVSWRWWRRMLHRSSPRRTCRRGVCARRGGAWVLQQPAAPPRASARWLPRRLLHPRLMFWLCCRHREGGGVLHGSTCGITSCRMRRPHAPSPAPPHRCSNPQPPHTHSRRAP